MLLREAYNIFANASTTRRPKFIVDYRSRGLWVANLVPVYDFDGHDYIGGLVALDDKTGQLYQFNPTDQRFPDYFEAAKNKTEFDENGREIFS